MTVGKKLFIKKGDNVMVIAGESKGQQGKVLVVDSKKQKAIIEGINLITKHAKPNAENPQGGIIKKEAPMHLSNLMIVDGSGKPTRIGRKRDEKSGKLVRYSKKSGEVIK
jgi:large subunit ribosomal protein L24